MSEYRIVEAIGTKELMEQVNKAIKEGWQPLGGICYAAKYFEYCQAMVR